MGPIWEWIKKELLELLPVFLFFFFFIMLLRITEWAILNELGIEERVIGVVLIFTLIIAKVFIVLDNLKLTNLFSNRPLIYNILWKTFFYSLTITLAHLIEKLFSHPLNHILESMIHARFWIIQTWTIVLVFIFSATRELIKKMGMDKFLKLLFSAP